MKRTETRILSNTTQTCIVLEGRQKDFAEIDASAKSYFGGKASPVMRDVFLVLCHLLLIGMLSLAKPLNHDPSPFDMIMMLAIVLNGFCILWRLGVMLERIRTGMASWRNVLLVRISEYQPQEVQPYRYLVSNILENGLQEERINEWLEREGVALKTREQNMMKGKHFSEKDEKIVKALKRRLEDR